MNWDPSENETANRLRDIVSRVLAESPHTKRYQLRFIEPEFGEFSGGWSIPIASDSHAGNARELLAVLDELQQSIEQQFTDGPVNVILDPALN